jgi:bifunctional non-homologous end joining protein LigD
LLAWAQSCGGIGTRDAAKADPKRKSMNPAYRPMLATLVDAPFDDQRWVFETKWDGFRLITEKRGHAVRLWSRNGIDVTTRYAVLLPALQKIDGSCVIDGELCALDAHGRSRFQLLQNALNKKAKLLYVVFDALFVGGKDIRKKPLLERKKILKARMPHDPLLRCSAHVAEFGKREFARAQRAREEGVIAKRGAGLYYSGKRTREWLKFKAVHEQEVVTVGYTEPRRSRKYFGSLVLAVRDKAKKRWVYAGHVGTGFDQAALKSLSETMRPLRTDEKPLDQKVKDESATTWLIPKLVGEVKFTEWTSEGEMRHPAFLGLRTDKKALDVIREQA